MDSLWANYRVLETLFWNGSLLQLHRETYPKFWAWSDGAEHHAMLRNQLHTVFGWTVRVGWEVNPRSLRNFPCQANGAEMLRWACSLATERGVGLVAPVHDAVLMEGPADTIAESVAETERAMAEASEAVLGGFRLRTEASTVRWPGRYMDKRGQEFWGRVLALLPDAAEAGSPQSLTESETLRIGAGGFSGGRGVVLVASLGGLEL